MINVNDEQSHGSANQDDTNQNFKSVMMGSKHSGEQNIHVEVDNDVYVIQDYHAAGKKAKEKQGECSVNVHTNTVDKQWSSM